MTKQSQAAQLACNIVVDYSSVPGSRVLPFEFSLNLTDSVLEPAPGQRQRFSYHVRGMGSSEFDHVNLSYFIIGMCESITPEDLGAIHVTRNGAVEEVTLGENVLFCPCDSPDPGTGCSGLKFQFSLDKQHGEMDISFELIRAYRVGPRPLCVYGSGVARNVLSLCGPVCRFDEKCARIAHQHARVSVPITVIPYVRVGEVSTLCSGAPEIRPADNPEDVPGCTFVVTQTMCVSVPLTFLADASAGRPDSLQIEPSADLDECITE